MHLVWQDAYPPVIYVRILETRGIKQSIHGFFCADVCGSTISVALKVFGPKKILAHIIGLVILNTNLEKICHFLELRISQK